MKKRFLILTVTTLTLFSLTACGINTSIFNKDSDTDETETVEDNDSDAEETEAAKSSDSNSEADNAESNESSDQNNSDIEASESESSTSEKSASEYLKKLLDTSGSSKQDIVSFICDDFDDDGKEEAFAIIGRNIDVDFDSVTDGTAWFVSEDKCEEIIVSGGMGLNKDIRTMTIGNTSYILFDDMFVSECYTHVYYVSDGQAHEAEFSCAGSVGTDGSDPDKFTIIDSSYDMSMDNEYGGMIGHTWKMYYFFYNSEDGQVYEYAGTTIDADTVEFWCGRDLVTEMVPKGDTVDSIFMRGNGHIVINYNHVDEYGSVNFYHYIYDQGEGYFIDDWGMKTGDEPLNGIYHSSLIPGMASYPEVPGPGDTVWCGE